MSRRNGFLALVLFACLPGLAAAVDQPVKQDRAKFAGAATEAAGHNGELQSGPLLDDRVQAKLAYQDSVVDALTRSNDARDLAFVPVLDVFRIIRPDAERSAASRKAIARAAGLAPNDALVQWVAMLADGATRDDAVARAAALRLQQLEPDNAVAYLADLASARAHHDDAAIDALLARMASAHRFDNHSADLLKGAAQIHARFSAGDPELSGLPDGTDPTVLPYMHALIAEPSFGLLPFSDLVSVCRAPKGRTAARAADCASIGRLMAMHADSTLGNRIGFMVLRVSHAYTDDDVQAERTADWMRKSYYAVLSGPDTESAQTMVSVMQAWIETGSELEARRNVLASHGIPATAPDDWVDTESQFTAEHLRQDEEVLAKRAADAK